MKITAIILLLLNVWTTCQALECTLMPGRLRQIDAGNGHVIGVCPKGEAFTIYNSRLVLLPGLFKHVTVGPAGIWGVNSTNHVHKLVKGDWENVPGNLWQVDAGGKMFTAGVNPGGVVFCLNEKYSAGYSGPGSPATWTKLPGKLKYYSCGPYSCWGVNNEDEVFIMKDVTPTACGGSLNMEKIPGSLSMVEVSTNGRVYGINKNGEIYQREGVLQCNPAGTGWRQIPHPVKVKHLAYDLGQLWLITLENTIYYCRD